MSTLTQDLRRTGAHKRPPLLPTRGQRIRATLVLSTLLVAFGGLVGRLWDLQVREHQRYAEVARKQQHRVKPLLPWRGNLLAEEDGRTVVVASSLARGSLLIEGKKTRDNEKFLERLDRAVPLSEEERSTLEHQLDAGRAFFWRRRKLGFEEMAKLRGVRLEGATVVEEPVRAYPFGSLGIQTLGLLSADGDGVSGVESSFGAELQGVRGLREVELDNRKGELLEASSVEVDPRPGLSVLLSMDRRIQAIVEEELDTLCEKWTPGGACVVVIELHTGNVLALASRPTFSPERIGEATPAAYTNHALNDTYEPGSTIKPLVVGAAWDEGLGDPLRAIFCPRHFFLPGRRKAVEDVHEVGQTTEAGVLVASSNAGAVQIGARLGMLKIRRVLETYGLGRRTGIALPGEAPGNVRALRKTDATTLGSVCQGYALMVTPLQMACAYAAIANGGTLYKPRIAQALMNADGEVVRRFEPVPVARVLSTKVAKEWLAPALERVVSDPHGTAHACKVPRYTLAGKTGTTKKIVNGAYSEREAITSFCGFAPYDEPRIAIAVVVFEPSTAKGKVWGGTVAAPAASAIVGKTLKYLGVPEQLPAEEPEKK